MITLRFKRILVPVDFSITATKAIIHAATLARKEQGTLILLHVWQKSGTGLTQEPGRTRMEQYRNKLRKLRDEVSRKYGVAVQDVLINGRRAAAIAKAAERYCVDMIVMGTNGYASETSLFQASISSRVIGKTTLPVLTIRNDNSPHNFSKILLPISLSSHSRQKVNAAIKLASLFNASLHMIGLLPRNGKHDHYKMLVIRNQIRKMAETRNIAFSSDIFFSDSPVSKTLAQARRLRTDLIISMTDEHSSDNWFFTAADRQLVNESRFPVLSIQPVIKERNAELPSMAGIW